MMMTGMEVEGVGEIERVRIKGPETESPRWNRG
jgi:hypothetical protein